MRKFVESELMVSSVREKLQELFNQQGRKAMRRELAQYCREVLVPAIAELGEADLVRHQLEGELVEVNEVVDNLKLVAGGLRLSG